MNERILWKTGEQFEVNLIKMKLEFLEKKWNIEFPKKYKKIVVNHNSGLPYVKYSDGEWYSAGIETPTSAGAKEMIELLSLKEHDIAGDISTGLEVSYEALSEALPDKLYPFAENGSGDKFLFDYRNNNEEPSIVFIDHDVLVIEDELSEDELEEKTLEEWQNETIYFIANSFDEFLDLIDCKE